MITDTVQLEKDKPNGEKKLNPMDYLENNYHNTCPKISWHNTNTYEIEKIIKSLKTKDSSGYEEITTRILKLSAPYISSPFTYICNKILSDGIYPDRLKYAVVKPIYKKGDEQDISNYRPISLLTSFSKVVEELIHARLQSHIITNDILCRDQYGFRSKYSTEQATFTLINNIQTAMNENQKVGGIFCDIRKAFDCVNHTILLDKLDFYGIKGKFKNLLKSYLTGRYQKVIIARSNLNSNSSEWEGINSGVPQGSVLGPLLFLLYINDLPSVIPKPNRVVLFADDTSILINDPNLQNLNITANQLFYDVNLWFNSNLLTLNYNKTHYVEYRTKNYYQTTTNIQYEGNTIPNHNSTKFLGIIMDETLTWNEL